MTGENSPKRLEAARCWGDVREDAVARKDSISRTVLYSAIPKEVFWLKPLASCRDFFSYFTLFSPHVNGCLTLLRASFKSKY